MSKTAQPQDEQSPASGEFSQETTLDVLSNRRRRFTVHFLKQQPQSRATVSELAERVACWENDKTSEELTYSERKRVRNALQQFHLSKMADQGFVEYDADRGIIELTNRAANANFYVDSLTGGKIPWGVYYLCLSAVSTLCLVGIWFAIPPFTTISPVLYGVFFVTALSVSSLGHFYDNYYRMRLGAREEPLEVSEDG